MRSIPPIHPHPGPGPLHDLESFVTYKTSLMLEKMSKEEIMMKLQQREGILQYCAIFLPVLGASMLNKHEYNPHQYFLQTGTKHVRTIESR